MLVLKGLEIEPFSSLGRQFFKIFIYLWLYGVLVAVYEPTSPELKGRFFFFFFSTAPVSDPLSLLRPPAGSGAELEGRFLTTKEVSVERTD